MDVLYLSSLFVAERCVHCWVAVMFPLGTAAFWKSRERFFLFLWVSKFWNMSQHVNNVINDCRAVKSHCTSGF